jgi:hypothetical protein
MSQEKKTEQSFDLRTLDSQLQRGIITQKEYEQYLKSLPDDEGNYEEAVITEDFPEAEEEEEEEEEEIISEITE